MKAFTRTSLAFLSSFVLGCATTKQKSLLEERASYGATPPSMNLSGSGSIKYVPTRAPETVIVPWLHAKELPSKDYFWGAWLSVVVTPEAWEVKKIEGPKPDRSNSQMESRPRQGPGNGKKGP